MGCRHGWIQDPHSLHHWLRLHGFGLLFWMLSRYARITLEALGFHPHSSESTMKEDSSLLLISRSDPTFPEPKAILYSS